MNKQKILQAKTNKQIDSRGNGFFPSLSFSCYSVWGKRLSPNGQSALQLKCWSADWFSQNVSIWEKGSSWLTEIPFPVELFGTLQEVVWGFSALGKGWNHPPLGFSSVSSCNGGVLFNLLRLPNNQHVLSWGQQVSEVEGMIIIMMMTEVSAGWWCLVWHCARIQRSSSSSLPLDLHSPVLEMLWCLRIWVFLGVCIFF